MFKREVDKKRSDREVRKGRRSIKSRWRGLKKYLDQHHNRSQHKSFRARTSRSLLELSPGSNRSSLDFINSLSMSKTCKEFMIAK